MDSNELDMMETLMPDTAANEESNLDLQVVMLFIAYSVVFVLALVGNILVGYSVLIEKSNQTVQTNVFITNLAVANILLCLFIVSLNLVFLIVDGWPFGSFMCHLWPCVYFSVCYASSITLAVIAVDRYSTLVHPLKERMKTRKLMTVVAIIWTVSIAASTPFGVYNAIVHFRDGEDNEFAACVPEWPSIDSSHLYLLATFIILLVIPLIVIAYFYIAISTIKLSHRFTTDSATHIADKRRTNRLLMAMAAVFWICWMPINVIELLINMYWPIHQWQYLQIAFRLSQVIAVSSACFNPLFYVWINKITLKKFCLLERCFKQRSKGGETADPTNTALKADVTYSAHCDAVNLASVERDG